MEKFKQYLLATIGLVIFIGAVTLFNPVQITGAPPVKDVNIANTPENPVPVVVQNGSTDDTVLITLAENLALARDASIQLDTIDVRGFRTVSILAHAEPDTGNSQTEGIGNLKMFWAVDELGSILNPIEGLLRGPGCDIRTFTICGNISDIGDLILVAGPFLSMRLSSNGFVDGSFTVRVFLQR